MALLLQIGIRFLLARQRALALSLAGVSLGVGLVILALSITTGFQTFFIRTVVGTEGAVRIEDAFQSATMTLPAEGMGVRVRSDRRYQAGVPEPRLVADALRRFPEVTAVSEVVRGSVLVFSGTREDAAQAHGIRIDEHVAVSALASQIVRGSLDSFRAGPGGVLMGRALADRLGVAEGDSVVLEFAGRRERFRVAALYETGVRDVDRVRVFMDINDARTLMDRPHGASYLQVALRDPARAPEVADRIEETVRHRATSWQERERVWLDVFRFFRLAALIFVTALIAVAGLGIFNTLSVLVMDKAREIAILRATGFTRWDIALVFLSQGGVLLAAGALAGCAVGAAATQLVSKIPIRVRGIFATERVLVAWNPVDYAFACGAAAVVILLAAWLPARRAAALEPADIVRGGER